MSRDIETRYHTQSFFSALWIWLAAFAAWLWIPIRRVSPAVLENLTEVGRTGYHPDNDLPIYVTAGVAAVLVSTRLAQKQALDRTISSPQTGELHSNDHSTGQSFGWIDLLAVAMILLLVGVVDSDVLVERGFTLEGFHHVDFYMMGPLQAFLHGRAVGSEAFAQYGGGWVLLYSLVDQIWHVDHSVFFATFPWFGALYFITAYGALRFLTGDACWSFVGLFVGVWLQLYCGTGAPMWIYPSSTVLRCPFDMLTAIALFKLQATRQIGWGLVAGGFGGLSLLFGADTGIYVLAGLGVASGLMVIQDVAKRDSHSVRGVIGIWIICCISIFTGLVLVSRGTLTESRFWSGYFEAVLAYGGGFGALPMRDAIRLPVVAVSFLAVLLIYTLTLSQTLARALNGRLEAKDLMRAFLATVGFGTLTIFVNRSHPFNLFHPILPACLLMTGILAESLPITNRGQAEPQANSKIARRLAATLAIVALIGLATNSNVWEYPSLIARVVASFKSTEPSEPAVPKFASEIREIAANLRKLKPGAELVIMGEDPTFWLATLNLPPVGRYCPTIPLTLAQAESIRQDAVRTRAISIIVTRFPRYHGDSIEAILRPDFELESETDRYAVYVRRPSDSR